MYMENIEIIRKELEAIKKLLALSLIKQGMDIASVGKAMGISSGRVSQMFAQKSYKKRRKENDK